MRSEQLTIAWATVGGCSGSDRDGVRDAGARAGTCTDRRNPRLLVDTSGEAALYRRCFPRRTPPGPTADRRRAPSSPTSTSSATPTPPPTATTRRPLQLSDFYNPHAFDTSQELRGEPRRAGRSPLRRRTRGYAMAGQGQAPPSSWIDIACPSGVPLQRGGGEERLLPGKHAKYASPAAASSSSILPRQPSTSTAPPPSPTSTGWTGKTYKVNYTYAVIDPALQARRPLPGRRLPQQRHRRHHHDEGRRGLRRRGHPHRLLRRQLVQHQRRRRTARPAAGRVQRPERLLRLTDADHASTGVPGPTSCGDGTSCSASAGLRGQDLLHVLVLDAPSRPSWTRAPRRLHGSRCPDRSALSDFTSRAPAPPGWVDLLLRSPERGRGGLARLARRHLLLRKRRARRKPRRATASGPGLQARPPRPSALGVALREGGHRPRLLTSSLDRGPHSQSHLSDYSRQERGADRLLVHHLRRPLPGRDASSYLRCRRPLQGQEGRGASSSWRCRSTGSSRSPR